MPRIVFLSAPYSNFSSDWKEMVKSRVILDVKPWGDETDMAEMEKQVRSIVKDGLV